MKKLVSFLLCIALLMSASSDVIAAEFITILNEDDEISGYCIDVMKQKNILIIRH